MIIVEYLKDTFQEFSVNYTVMRLKELTSVK